MEEFIEEEIKNNKLDEQERLLIEAQIKNSNLIKDQTIIQSVEELDKIVDEQISNDNDKVRKIFNFK